MTAVLRCGVCGATVGADTVDPWRCPNSSELDRHHVLRRVPHEPGLRVIDDPHPFVRYDAHLVWARLAEVRGLDLGARSRLVHRVDDLVREVDGRGFVETPLWPADELGARLGIAPGGLWLKDETVDVAGSAKARHLLSILLYLLSTELAGIRAPAQRASLAIASCGNAALAAATLAASVTWPLEVFVPTDAPAAVLAELRRLGASITTCERRADDPPGDPCMHRFREAVRGGAVPFSVQGTENALCLDGGRTIAWECAERLGPQLTDVYVQVGGGALAASFGMGFADAGSTPRLHAVQAQGCAPLARAWERWRSDPERGWSEVMWPWDSPHSIATGILDDETYDWLTIAESMRDSNGGPVVVSEAQLGEANRLLVETTAVHADHTATAALAGLLATGAAPGDVVLVPITGVRR